MAGSLVCSSYLHVHTVFINSWESSLTLQKPATFAEANTKPPIAEIPGTYSLPALDTKRHYNS